MSDADWLAHIDAQAHCGLSVPEYARQHGLRADTLYKRRRRLAATRAPARLVPVAVEVPSFCEFALPDGGVLRFPDTLDPETLGAWVTALRSR